MDPTTLLPARGAASRLTLAAAALALSLVARPGFAAPPSAGEQALFDAITARLAAHAGSMPKGVGAATASLTADCWTSTVPCPPGELTCIKYKVCTKLVAWSAAAAGAEQGAAYVWDTSPTITTESNCKVVVMNNSIMVDEAALSPGEAPGRGDIDKAINEALVYHELLHAQIGIEALSTPEIVNPVCQCAGPNPGARSDGGHQVIPGLQDAYISAVGAALGANVQVLRIAPAAGSNGGFAMDFGPIAAGCFVNVVVPNNGNVADIHVGERDANNHVAVTGTLEDAGKAGGLIVLIDPPLLWQIVYAEISTGPTPVRSTTWGRLKQIYR